MHISRYKGFCYWILCDFGVGFDENFSQLKELVPANDLAVFSQNLDES